MVEMKTVSCRDKDLPSPFTNFYLGGEVILSLVASEERSKAYLQHFNSLALVPFSEVLEKVSGTDGVERKIYNWRLARGY